MRVTLRTQLASLGGFTSSFTSSIHLVDGLEVSASLVPRLRHVSLGPQEPKPGARCSGIESALCACLPLTKEYSLSHIRDPTII